MIQFDYRLCFLAALLLMILPLDWLLSAVIAAVFHELCHIFLLWMLNGNIQSVKLGAEGCVIEATGIGEVGQFLSILAGPLGSLALVLFCRTAPKIGVCGLIHGLYNLLPVLPLDGGRLLQLLLYRICPGKAEYLSDVVAIAVCIAAVLGGLCLSLAVSTGIWPLLITIVWSIKSLVRKIPCKPS